MESVHLVAGMQQVSEFHSKSYLCPGECRDRLDDEDVVGNIGNRNSRETLEDQASTAWECGFGKTINVSILHSIPLASPYLVAAMPVHRHAQREAVPVKRGRDHVMLCRRLALHSSWGDLALDLALASRRGWAGLRKPRQCLRSKRAKR